MVVNLLYFLLGLLTGGAGTLIGAGGGFLLVPLFLFLFPQMPAARLTALSLLAVSANSISGTFGYAFRKNVHWPSTFLFSVWALPGVWLGVHLVGMIPRGKFDSIFSVILICLSVFVLWKSFKRKSEAHRTESFWTARTKILGSFVSFFVGTFSSLLGIGGGIIHVPLLSEVLLYPVHLAAGTSHSILAITSFFGVVEHIRAGDLFPMESFVPFLVVGLVVGAQGGAAVSKRISGKWILRSLGAALFLMALRLLFRQIH